MKFIIIDIKMCTSASFKDNKWIHSQVLVIMLVKKVGLVGIFFYYRWRNKSHRGAFESESLEFCRITPQNNWWDFGEIQQECVLVRYCLHWSLKVPRVIFSVCLASVTRIRDNDIEKDVVHRTHEVKVNFMRL